MYCNSRWIHWVAVWVFTAFLCLHPMHLGHFLLPLWGAGMASWFLSSLKLLNGQVVPCPLVPPSPLDDHLPLPFQPSNSFSLWALNGGHRLPVQSPPWPSKGAHAYCGTHDKQAIIDDSDPFVFFFYLIDIFSYVCCPYLNLKISYHFATTVIVTYLFYKGGPIHTTSVCYSSKKVSINIYA